MPGFDGTGPTGKGPFTGRGRGICGGFPVKGGTLGTIMTALAVPAVGALINDIRKPDGVTRRLFASAINRIASRKSRLVSTEQTSRRIVERGEDNE